MLYRIAVFATLAYISVFVSASLLFMTAFFTAPLVPAALPSPNAWAGPMVPAVIAANNTSHLNPLITVFPTKSPLTLGATQKAIRVANVSIKHNPRPPLTRRGWDRNLNAHPARGLYKRSLRVLATAYTPINTRMEGGRYTFTERDGRAVHGIAVDPRLIPIGSQLWIPGYGHAVADDTGGRIRGHHVDVRIQDYDRMLEWGCRTIQIYVISDGSEAHAKKAASRYIRRA